MKQFIITSFLCSLLNVLAAQKATTILEQVTAHYNTQQAYTLTTTYSLYRGHNRSRVSEQYKSKTIKKQDVLYIRVLESEVLQEPRLRLVIDHQAKDIHYQPLSVQQQGQVALQLNSLLKYYKLVEDSEVKGTRNLTFELKNKQLPVDYFKIKLFVDMSSYALLKQEMYSNRLTKFYNDNGTTEHEKSLLILEFEESATQEKIPDFSDFIQVESANKVLVTEEYAQYRIIKNEKK